MSGHVKEMPIIQRLPCTLHADKVAAICPKCFDLAERQQQQQWARQRKDLHEVYLLEQKEKRDRHTGIHSRA